MSGDKTNQLEKNTKDGVRFFHNGSEFHLEILEELKKKGYDIHEITTGYSLPIMDISGIRYSGYKQISCFFNLCLSY